jgi:hypothetical protein
MGIIWIRKTAGRRSSIWTLTILNGEKTRLTYEGSNGNDIYHVRLEPKLYWRELFEGLQAKIDRGEVYGDAKVNTKKHLQDVKANWM